jgi:hypothetical protein
LIYAGNTEDFKAGAIDIQQSALAIVQFNADWGLIINILK